MKETFSEWVDAQDDYGICPPPLSDARALEFLKDYLLGENWYVVMPLSKEQCNTEIVHGILKDYSQKYRKELRDRKK